MGSLTFVVRWEKSGSWCGRSKPWEDSAGASWMGIDGLGSIMMGFLYHCPQRVAFLWSSSTVVTCFEVSPGFLKKWIIVDRGFVVMLEVDR